MTVSPECHQLRPHLSIWHRYDPASKVDLFSTLLASGSGLWLIDPSTPLPVQIAARVDAEPVAGVILTNANHERAAHPLERLFRCPVYAHPEVAPEIRSVTDVTTIADFTVVPIPGAAPGEVALLHPDDGGTLIVGDALIHMQGTGFTFLPAKYCTNQRLMRRSLRALLDLEFVRILFAHGLPIVNRAHDRLAPLLETP